MKICVVGATCSGKTTLADKLEAKFGWKHFDLDRIFIDIEELIKSRNFRYVPRERYMAGIEKILREEEDWIIEGVYVVGDIFEAADKIVYLERPWWLPVFWQWKRFINDKKQREEFGFWNNVGLSWDIFRQYWLGEIDGLETHYSVVKLKRWVGKYRQKLVKENDILRG